MHLISDRENKDRKADVVFVHGLGGDACATWRYGKGDETSWPHWLAQEFPEAGVWSLGYAAAPTKWPRLVALISRSRRDSGHAMSIPDRAQQVLDLLVQKGIGQRPLLFICHSLGGLVVKQVLRASSDASHMPGKSAVFVNTRAVLFLATPHSGSDLATFLGSIPLALPTVAIDNLAAHDSHLRDLYNWYRNHTFTRIHTRTYNETKGVRNALKIVNPTSAHPGVGADPVPLDEDHISIAKPRDHASQVCDAARDMLRNYVLSPARPAADAGTAPNVEAIEYPDRDAARQRVLPLLRQNKSIFETYGPHNDYRYDPESETAAVWKGKLLAQVIPNNKRILAILDANRRHLDWEEAIILEKFRQHLDDLETRHLRGASIGGGITFPQGMETILGGDK